MYHKKEVLCCEGDHYFTPLLGRCWRCLVGEKLSLPPLPSGLVSPGSHGAVGIAALPVPLVEVTNILSPLESRGAIAPGSRAATPVEVVEIATGEVLAEMPLVGETAEKLGAARKRVRGRLERYVLQDAAREILFEERVAWCLRRRRRGKQGIEVLRDVEHGTTYYGNLQVCSQVWVCPVCAAKITERRRQELQQGMARFREMGGDVALVTLTFPHQREDDLQVMMKRLKDARNKLRGGKMASRLRQDVGLVGLVRALEVTYGERNGWHPHVHELWFMEKPLEAALLKERIGKSWRSEAVKAGFQEPTVAHGVDVRDGTWAASYAAKWGLEAELTKGHSKKGRGERRTPFDLLRCYVAGKERGKWGGLFREYAAAFAGGHQLHWSKGLKKKVGLKNKSDEEINTETRESAEVVGRLHIIDWQRVLRGGLRGVVLELAREGWKPVEELLVGLREAERRQRVARGRGLGAAPG